MPIYEYEPVGRECLICPGRIEVLRRVDDAPLQWCPHCGLEVRRIVSRAQFNIPKGLDYDKAGERGLTTFRRVEKGKWEKLAGPGADMLVGSPEDMAQ
ncbi:MAG: hypothetical protein C4320_08645, partial [Armatimonadota bacterium]